MLRKFILYLILLLNASIVTAAERDSSLLAIIAKGQSALQAMKTQNHINDSLGLSDQNQYVLDISTLPLDSLTKEFIKQYRVRYPTDDAQKASRWFIRDGDPLNALNKKLQDLNNASDTKIKTYMLMVDYVPMSFPDLLGKDVTAEQLFSKERANTDNGQIAQKALATAAAIVEGITKPFLAGRTDKVLYCGFLKIKVWTAATRKRDIFIYYPHNNVEDDNVNLYKTILRTYMSHIVYTDAPTYVEDFIVAAAGNNKDYLQFPNVRAKMMAVTDPNVMDSLLRTMGDNAYSPFTVEERLHAIKILASTNLLDDRANLLSALIETTPTEQADVVITAMENFNDEATASYQYIAGYNENEGKPIVKNVYNQKKDWHLISGILNNFKSPYEIIREWNDATYVRQVKAVTGLIFKAPSIADRVVAYYKDNNTARTIVWDQDYSLSYLTNPPTGVNRFDVSTNMEDGAITLTKEQLTGFEYPIPEQTLQDFFRSPRTLALMGSSVLTEGMRMPSWNVVEKALDSLDAATYNFIKPIFSIEKWEKEPSITLQPFDLISFTDKSLLSIFGGEENQKEIRLGFLPAFALQHAKRKETNADTKKKFEIGADALMLVVPVGELAHLGKLANYVYKSLEIAGKLAAGSRMLVNLGGIDPSSKLAAVIREFHEVTMLLQLTNVGLSLANGRLATLTQLQGEKYLRTYYEASTEMKALAGRNIPEIEAMNRLAKELEAGGEAARFGSSWAANLYKSAKDLKAAIVSKYTSTIAKFKEFAFLKQDAEVKNLVTLLDKEGNVIARQGNDGEWIIEKLASSAPKGSKMAGIVEDANFVTKEGIFIKDDIMLLRNADGTITCLRGACFVAGTPVHTPTGLRPIEQIKADDIVIGVDKKTGDTVWQKVVGNYNKPAENLVRIIIENDTILSTPEHPYLTTEGWKSAGEIVQGQKLRMAGKLVATVLSIMPLDTAATVYNFETAITHNYCVGTAGIVVHNDCEWAKELEKVLETKVYEQMVVELIDNQAVVNQILNKEISGEAVGLLFKYPAIRTSATYLELATKAVASTTKAEQVTKFAEIMSNASSAALDGWKALDAKDLALAIEVETSTAADIVSAYPELAEAARKGDKAAITIIGYRMKLQNWRCSKPSTLDESYLLLVKRRLQERTPELTDWWFTPELDKRGMLAKSESDAILDMTPRAPELDEYLYRFDSRSPEEIKALGGFKAWGDDMFLLSHLKGQNVTGPYEFRTSGFIGSSRSTDALQEWVDGYGEGYIYRIKTPGSAMDINTRFTSNDTYTWENEVVIPHEIPYKYIVDWKFVVSDGP